MLSHTIKVNKIIVTVLWLFLLGSIYGAVREATFIGIVLLCGSGIGIVTSSIFIHKKIFQKTTSLIIILSYILQNISILSNQYISGMLIMIGLCIAALFLNKYYLLICGAFYDIALVLTEILTRGFQTWIFIATFISIQFVILILFFLCKWGNNLVYAAEKSEAISKEYLNSLDAIIELVRKNTISLNEDVTNCYESIGAVKKNSSIMASNAQEITEGVVNQS